MNPRPLGILGGMGPAATARFHALVIESAQRLYGAQRDTDFPQISLVSAHVDGFTAGAFDAWGTFESVLQEKLTQLLALNPEIIAIPCNTAHSVFSKLTASSSVPIIHMIDAVHAKLDAQNIVRVAIFATLSTTTQGLYARSDKEIIALTLEEQEQVRTLIDRGEAGLHDDSDTKTLATLTTSLASRGAQGIVLGCTELSTISLPSTNIPIVDSSATLAEAAVRACYKDRM